MYVAILSLDLLSDRVDHAMRQRRRVDMRKTTSVKRTKSRLRGVPEGRYNKEGRKTGESSVFPFTQVTSRATANDGSSRVAFYGPSRTKVLKLARKYANEYIDDIWLYSATLNY